MPLLTGARALFIDVAIKDEKASSYGRSCSDLSYSEYDQEPTQGFENCLGVSEHTHSTTPYSSSSQTTRIVDKEKETPGCGTESPTNGKEFMRMEQELTKLRNDNTELKRDYQHVQKLNALLMQENAKLKSSYATAGKKEKIERYLQVPKKEYNIADITIPTIAYLASSNEDTVSAIGSSIKGEDQQDKITREAENYLQYEVETPPYHENKTINKHIATETSEEQPTKPYCTQRKAAFVLDAVSGFVDLKLEPFSSIKLDKGNDNGYNESSATDTEQKPRNCRGLSWLTMNRFRGQTQAEQKVFSDATSKDFLVPDTDNATNPETSGSEEEDSGYNAREDLLDLIGGNDDEMPLEIEEYQRAARINQAKIYQQQTFGYL